MSSRISGRRQGCWGFDIVILVRGWPDIYKSPWAVTLESGQDDIVDMGKEKTEPPTGFPCLIYAETDTASRPQRALEYPFQF